MSLSPGSRLGVYEVTALIGDEAVTRLNQCLHSWSPDASSFLFHEIHPERPDPRGDRTHVEVILNWFQELKQRVPVP